MSDIKQAENIVEIQGYVSELNIREGEKDGQKTLMGDVTIRTTVKDKTIECPVSFYAKEKTNSGAANPAYAAAEELKTLTSLAACGDMEKADIIEFNRAQLTENRFLGRDGSLVSTPRIKGSFFNKISKEKYEPTARFTNTIVVQNIKDEVDKEGVETGRLIVTGILVQYGGHGDVVNYVAENPAAVSHIRDNYEKGDTVTISGIVSFTSTVEEYTEEVGFGEPITRKRTRNVKELIITSGSPACLDDEYCYTPAQVKEVLASRDKSIEDLKAKSKAKAPAKAQSKADSFGF